MKKQSTQANNAYKIDKGFPAPPPRVPRYPPLRTMEVGDSFAITDRERGNVSVACSYLHKTSTKRFSLRKQESGYRCWRIE